MFLIQNGLNLLQVNMVNLVFFTTIVLAEIPTGIFADIFGRKKSVILSCVIQCLGMLIYAFSKNTWGFVLAEAVIALGYTFSSGAFRSWFVDRLRYYGYSERLTKVFSRVDLTSKMTGIVAAMIGAYLFDIAPIVPWIIGATAFVVCGITASFVKEEYFVKKMFFLKDAGGLIGFIYAGISLSMILGTLVAPRISDRIVCEKKTLIFLQASIGVGIFASVITNSFILSVLAFMLHEFFRGSFDPVKSSYLHENIPSEQRATIESLESSVQKGGGMIGLCVSGFLAQKFGIPFTWMIFGSLMFFGTLYVGIRGSKDKKGR